VGCIYTGVAKTRTWDRGITVSMPDTRCWAGCKPVLVDDITSTAQTMIAAVARLKEAGLPPPVCVTVHPIFAGNAYLDLQAAGVARIVSCNTIAHASNQIDISDAVAVAAVELMAILPING